MKARVLLIGDNSKILKNMERMKSRTSLLYILVFLLAILSSCSRVKEKGDDDMHPEFVLNNADLEQAILEYQQRIFADNQKRMARGDSVYVNVFAKGINDSITRYILFPLVNHFSIECHAPFFVNKVGGHYVFFTFRGARFGYREKDQVHKLSEESCETQFKKFFPNEYREMHSSKHRLHSVYLYEPENCYLTFLYDSLIDKTYKRGADFDKILIHINGKDVYM